MKIQQALIIVLTSTLFVCSAVGVDIHFAGDSTLAPRAADSQIKSWGDMLRPRLVEGCQIHNYAISGTSTVTFQKTWNTKLIGQIKEGDYVFIQFGHNDPWHTEKKYEVIAKPRR
ncbi:MAG: SGNH/GDSL hydrolase family protein [bacterium]|nr:SGNH/GDSL hydrolase family protein [bacterium]